MPYGELKTKKGVVRTFTDRDPEKVIDYLKREKTAWEQSDQFIGQSLFIEINGRRI